MVRARAVAALLVALVVGVGAGCGGSGGDGDDTPTLSATAYVAQANRVCADAKARQAKAFQGVDTKDRDALIAASRKAGEQTKAALKQLDALHGPDAEEALVDRFLARAKEIDAAANRRASSDEIARRSRTAQSAARAAGLGECA